VSIKKYGSGGGKFDGEKLALGVRSPFLLILKMEARPLGSAI